MAAARARRPERARRVRRGSGRAGAGATRALAELERLRTTLDARLAPRKRALLERVWRGRLAGVAALVRFHDLLCFMQAYVETPALEATARRMRLGFARRYARELARHRAALVNSGIAGTSIRFRFFSETGRWLAARAPHALHVDWDAFEDADRLAALLPLLAHPAESPGLDEVAFETREWIARMKRRDETDAAFLARRFAQLPMDDLARELLWDGLDIPFRLEPSPATPSRTRTGLRPRRVHHVATPLPRTRPDLVRELERAPRRVRALAPREGAVFVDLARAAMVTRERDLDAFAYGDPHDVRLVEYEDELAFAAIGVVPERRLLLEAVYGYLTLKNGVPIGYVLTSALYGSSELAYNVFDTWRGVEAATVYARVLAMTRHLFGTDTFTIYPYQLGDGNDEAIESGAWWFYHKLGFTPRDPETRRRVAREHRRMAADPAYRSSPATLRRLARENLYLQPYGTRDDVIGLLPLAGVGLAATERLSARFGSDRRSAVAVCAAEAAERLGARGWTRWSADERRAFERWAPVVLALPGLARWTPAERRAAAEVIRLKGSRRESDFVRAFDAHRPLRLALARLARANDPERA